MGNSAYDMYTLAHFVFGIFATYSLWPDDIYVSFVLSNVVHFFIEIAEKNQHPQTKKILESDTNHATDIFAFFIGSIIAVILSSIWPIENYSYVRPVLFLLVSFVFLLEFTREIFPNYKIGGILKGAYV